MEMATFPEKLIRPYYTILHNITFHEAGNFLFR